MPKAFSEREKELISERLLEEGDKLFSTFGLRKTNVEELARAAGISKGAFYGFYESKEALFMDVVEQVEVRVRQQVLAAIELPGPSPRARLFAVLKKAFALFEATPILRFYTIGDYELLFRRVPAEKLQEHLTSDKAFFAELITHCRNAGIPIKVPPEQFVGLLYPLVEAVFQNGEWGQQTLGGNTGVLLELIAAFCLGEIDVHCQEETSSAAEEGDSR